MAGWIGQLHAAIDPFVEANQVRYGQGHCIGLAQDVEDPGTGVVEAA
ncbi:hypothetical protein [Mesorhizobium sp. M1396]